MSDETTTSEEAGEVDDAPEVEVLTDDEGSSTDIGQTQLERTSEMLGDLSLPLARGSEVDLPANADPLTAYLARLSYIEPLSADDQQELAERYVEANDINAGKMLILTNLRLVVKIAREYKRRWSDLLDLIQEGNVGLSEAVTRYDPYRGVKFTSYAQYWVRAMILNYLMNHFHPVKIGSSRAGRKLFYNLKKARRELIRRGHENPTPALIADYLDVDEQEVVRVSAQMDAPPVYIDAKAPGYDKTTVGELMESDVEGPEELVGDYEVHSKIRDTVKAFGETIDDDRERAIWSERMIADDGKSLSQLGDEWGVSKERIRQVEMKIRERFKNFLVDRLGEDVTIDFLEQ